MRYRAELTSLVKKMVDEGYSNMEIRRVLHVNRKTFLQWRLDEAEFEAALVRSKEHILRAAERALVKLAIGYTLRKQRALLKRGSKEVMIINSEQHVVPNSNAIAFLLNNRRPELWQRHRPPPPPPKSREDQERDDAFGRGWRKFVEDNYEKFKEEYEQGGAKWPFSGLAWRD